jgi:secondary thiamine-phosphate synthase enzyme
MNYSSFPVKTHQRTELVDITSRVAGAVSASGIQEGFCLVYCPHTTAGITINENADPAVQRDILMEINKVIPFEDHYTHMEGNSAAHLKSTLTGTSETIPIHNGRLILGTWQGIYFCEYDGPRSRNVHLQIIGQA